MPALHWMFWDQLKSGNFPFQVNLPILCLELKHVALLTVTKLECSLLAKISYEHKSSIQRKTHLCKHFVQQLINFVGKYAKCNW